MNGSPVSVNNLWNDCSLQNNYRYTKYSFAKGENYPYVLYNIPKMDMVFSENLSDFRRQTKIIDKNILKHKVTRLLPFLLNQIIQKLQFLDNMISKKYQSDVSLVASEFHYSAKHQSSVPKARNGESI